MSKILVLPEVNINFEWWWSYAVSKNMHISDKNNFFNYIIIKWIWNNKVLPKTLLPKKIIDIVSKSMFINFLYHIKLILNYRNILKSYKLNNYNFIISHNILQTYVLSNIMKKKNILYVHHLNWTYYNEYSQRNFKSLIFNFFCNHIEKKIFTKVKHIWFPSIWAKENFWNKKLLNWKDYNFFYNWVNYKNINNKKIKKYSFITVLDCTKFKWIDRIIDFLNWLKKRDIDFHWTYIWKWPLLEDIKNKIEKYNLNKKITIINQRIEKNKIIELMSENNFYIWLHRTSIFDYATLEAMSQWCIPILSNIWWNKEVIIDNNWLLINNKKLKNSADIFIEYIKNNSLKELSIKNINLIKNNFSSEKFINRYINFCKKNVK